MIVHKQVHLRILSGNVLRFCKNTSNATSLRKTENPVGACALILDYKESLFPPRVVEENEQVSESEIACRIKS